MNNNTITIEQKAAAITILNKIASGQKINFHERNILNIYNKKTGRISAEKEKNGQKH